VLIKFATGDEFGFRHCRGRQAVSSYTLGRAASTCRPFANRFLQPLAHSPWAL